MCGGGWVPQSIPASDLEKTFSKILEKLGLQVPAKYIDACHCVGKQGRVIVKLLRRKDCQQILIVKNYLPKKDMFITTSYGHKVKHYLQWVKYITISFPMEQLKYVPDQHR